jgi:hypothetical protein
MQTFVELKSIAELQNIADVKLLLRLQTVVKAGSKAYGLFRGSSIGGDSVGGTELLKLFRKNEDGSSVSPFSGSERVTVMEAVKVGEWRFNPERELWPSFQAIETHLLKVLSTELHVCYHAKA